MPHGVRSTMVVSSWTDPSPSFSRIERDAQTRISVLDRFAQAEKGPAMKREAHVHRYLKIPRLIECEREPEDRTTPSAAPEVFLRQSQRRPPGTRLATREAGNDPMSAHVPVHSCASQDSRM